MPQASSLYQSPLLSQIAVDFKNRAYIGDRVLTPVMVPKMQGQYLVWDQGITFKRQDTTMAQGGQANRIDVKGTKTPFILTTHALQASVDPLERDQAPEAQIEAMKVSKLANQMLLDRECEIATAVLEPTQYGSGSGNSDDLSGSDQWSNVDSDPVRAIIAAHDVLPMRANVFLAGRDVISALRVHPKILEALQFSSSAGIASLEQLARLFEVDEILVGDAFIDTAGNGLAADKELIWQEAAGGGVALLFHRASTPPSPLMDQPTLGYLPTMHGSQVYKWVDQNYGTGSGVTNIKMESAWAPLMSAPEMAFQFTSVLT